MIVGKETCLEIANKLVKEALNLGATQAEARVQNFSSYLTRFANSVIHQNVGESNFSLTLRFVLGKRISTVSSNEWGLEAIKKLAERGCKLAKVLEENPEFVSLPEPEPIEELEGLYIKETAECTPDTRAEMVKALIDEAHSLSPKVKEVAGALSTTSLEMAVVNSLGINAYAKSTIANLETIIISRENGVEGFGYAGDVSRNVKELNPVAIGIEAAERSVNSLGAKKIEPGEYEVILEPYAMGTALSYTSYGLSAQAYQDGTSFMNDLMGKKAFNEQFTLWDDGRDLKGLAFPFDLEGVPKKKIMLIEEGTPKNIVYDSYTAHKEGKKSTGHAAGYGPIPTHLFMKPGNATKEEMIKETKKGLLVTRLHYVRTVHPRKLVITGMTRDGTWLIENGEIKHPVKNLRFTESLLRTYANIELIGKEVKRIGRRWYGSILTPAIKAKVFLFTGVTEY
ncbi:MAG: TldD/PmbA family protein [archaeon GB-1867-035]|nr:TldD/PmbA family protein [Candidatus Culexmicrobium profundum]